MFSSMIIEIVYTNQVTKVSTVRVPVTVWARREPIATGRFLYRVDANRTLAHGRPTLESGSRPEHVWTRPY